MSYGRGRRLAWTAAIALLPLVSAACGGGGGAGAAGDSGGQKAGGFVRPATNGAVPEAVKTACTADKSPKIRSILDRGQLNWALGIAPPFGLKDPQGKYIGIEVDNANELAHYLGVKVNIHDYDYNFLPTAIVSGQADIIGAELFHTAPRAEVVDFSDFYFVAGQLFFVLQDSPWQTIDGLNSPDNTFVHEIGGGQVELAKKLLPKAPIKTVPKRGQILVGYEFMKNGQGDSTAFEGHYWPVLHKQYPDLVAIGSSGRITDTSGDWASQEVEPFDIGFGLPKNDAGWKACVNAYVHDLLDTGRLRDRITYWTAYIGE
jgi:polar amino acid transport system substrate-binding protein